MIARTHDLAAVTALGVVVLAVPAQPIALSTVIVAILANLIGGVLPDIDQPTAPFWRNLPIGKYFGRVLDKMLGGHRFITHSIVGLVLVGYLLRLLLMFLQPIMGSVDINIVWWAFMIGILSHLILDTFNKEGVPWLLPIPVKIGFPPVKAWRISTDKWVENWVVFPGLLIFNCVLYFQNYHYVLYLLHNMII
jgi:inner membrane protein